ncbi:MAG: RNA polymerase factor sigma-54 [Actinobacteria bacterium]|nr:RNA polymerase factor sigma-54 [Actinomycetota bacterium]
MELTQKPELKQRITLSPQVYQGLSMLAMPAVELQNLISAELVENPTLEVEEPESPFDDRDSDTEAPPTEEDRAWEEWLDSYEEIDSTEVPRLRDPDAEIASIETYVGSTETFSEYLLGQLGLMTLEDEVRRACEVVVGLLDSDGYFTGDSDEVAAIAGVDEPIARQAIAHVQQLDPPGVGASSLIEALQAQVRFLQLDDPVLDAIIAHHLEDVAFRRFRKISRALRVTEDQVRDRVQALKKLNPRPAGEFSPGPSPGFVVPDVVVRRFDDQWLVLSNNESVPSLRVSSRYRSLLRAGSSADEETRRYLKDKIRSAETFIRNLDRRKSTVGRIAEVVVEVQNDFFENGKGPLKPLKLEDVALELGVHLSTVSRGATGKYMMTPYGLFEIKYFFSGGYRTNTGMDVASTSIKQRIRQIIADEDRARPYSDQKLVELLGSEGITVARRTVAKYREELRIDPSWARKNQ